MKDEKKLLTIKEWIKEIKECIEESIGKKIREIDYLIDTMIEKQDIPKEKKTKRLYLSFEEWYPVYIFKEKEDGFNFPVVVDEDLYNQYLVILDMYDKIHSQLAKSMMKNEEEMMKNKEE